MSRPQSTRVLQLAGDARETRAVPGVQGLDRVGICIYVYGMKRLVVNIPEELHRRLKIACTLQGKTMTQVALRLLSEFVEKEEKRKLIVYPKS